MIQVSSEFKKAIKEPERKIKGYVEVLYDLPSIEITPTSSITSTYTDINDMLEGNRVKQNYGTVDYLPLDGSMLTMDDTTNDNSGFISDYVVEHYFTPRDEYLYLNLSFEETTIKGLTIYLRDNAIKAYSYSLSDGTVEYKTLDDYESQIQIIFDSPKTITSVQLGLGDFEYIQRKLKIDRIDLGISSVYKDQDLIDFTVDEEVNKLVEEVPINETNITLNNMSDLFNPLNPTGIVPYLSENTLIKPYIGVLTENNGIEYVKMGEFYFDSYTNNSDATTTLVGKNLMNQIKEADATDGLINTTSVFIDMPSGTPPNTTEAIVEGCGYSIDTSVATKYPYYTMLLKDTNLLNLLKGYALLNYSLFYVNRNNNIVLKDIDTTNVDTLTKTELINDAVFTKIDKINFIKLKYDSKKEQTQSTATSRTYKILDDTVILTEATQRFLIQKLEPDILKNVSGITYSYSGASSINILFETSFFVIVELTGTIGTSVNVVATKTITTNVTGTQTITTTIDKTNIGSEKQVLIEIENQMSGFYSLAKTSLGQLEYAPSYEMSFDYNGDPSLEAGDYINVETLYGYKKLFIQKNRFKFDGGLEGSIEGVE